MLKLLLMKKNLKRVDTIALKKLYAKEAKGLGKSTSEQFQEHKKLVTDLAIEIYKRFHSTLSFNAMEQPVRPIKLY